MRPGDGAVRGVEHGEHATIRSHAHQLLAAGGPQHGSGPYIEVPPRVRVQARLPEHVARGDIKRQQTIGRVADADDPAARVIDRS